MANEDPARDMTGTATRIELATAETVARLGLLAELDADLIVRYPDEPTNGVETEGFEESGGCFVLARHAGEPAGCGAFRPMDAETVEIKRMFVRASARGQGLAGALLAALEVEARQRGFKRALLETGIHQPEAIAVYRRHGYRPIACYGEYATNPFSVCFGKSLTGDPTPLPGELP